MDARLILENGSVYLGRSFGYEGEDGLYSLGEIVFNTSMTGYQEILTDPSYYNQIVVMTYPLIGNYGINGEDLESSRVQVSGMVVREYESLYSSFRGSMSLSDYLVSSRVLGIESVDTRRLVREIRECGSLRGVIALGGAYSDAELYEVVRNFPIMEGCNLTGYVSTSSVYSFGSLDARYKVVAIDYGIKRNILRIFESNSCSVAVVPVSSGVDEILSLCPDGIFLSNGPGDPASVLGAIGVVRGLISVGKPIFGICLGHQILSLALGAKTYKLKFGHRGSNHPVRNMLTGRVEITSQNHGFAVSGESLPSDLELTHINLNDSTVEGIRHRELPLFSIQYHPESSPGPHDSLYLFDEFISLLGLWLGIFFIFHFAFVP